MLWGDWAGTELLESATSCAVSGGCRGSNRCFPCMAQLNCPFKEMSPWLAEIWLSQVYTTHLSSVFPDAVCVAYSSRVHNWAKSTYLSNKWTSSSQKLGHIQAQTCWFESCNYTFLFLRESSLSSALQNCFEPPVGDHLLTIFTLSPHCSLMTSDRWRCISSP